MTRQERIFSLASYGGTFGNNDEYIRLEVKCREKTKPGWSLSHKTMIRDPVDGKWYKFFSGPHGEMSWRSIPKAMSDLLDLAIWPHGQ